MEACIRSQNENGIRAYCTPFPLGSRSPIPLKGIGMSQPGQTNPPQQNIPPVDPPQLPPAPASAPQPAAKPPVIVQQGENYGSQIAAMQQTLASLPEKLVDSFRSLSQTTPDAPQTPGTPPAGTAGTTSPATPPQQDTPPATPPVEQPPTRRERFQKAWFGS